MASAGAPIANPTAIANLPIVTHDVRWRSGARVTDRPTLAAATLLYFGLATPAQGSAVAARLERDFLAPGGFLTTRIASGQQWDAPNGWPPLEWLAIEGARRYGRADLADRARARWLSLNRRVYRATGKMTEKYDVVDATRAAGGGEYPTQDGFGWTNGVALALAGTTPFTPSQPPRAQGKNAIASSSEPNPKLVSPKIMLSYGRYFAMSQVRLVCIPVTVRMKPGTAKASAHGAGSTSAPRVSARMKCTIDIRALPAATAP